MTFLNFYNMKKILLTLAAACIFAACDEKDIVTPDGGDCGFISVGIDTDDSIYLKSVSDGELDAYKVTVGDDTVSYSELKGVPYLIKSGTYTVYAQNCTADEAVAANNGLGQKHIYGETGPVEVTSGVTTPVKISCSVINAAAAVLFTDSFKAAFETYSVVLDADSRNISVDDSNADAEFYWNMDEDGKYTLHYIVYAVPKGTEDVRTARGSVTLSRAVKSTLRFSAAESESPDAAAAACSKTPYTDNSSQRISFSSVREMISPIRSEAF